MFAARAASAGSITRRPAASAFCQEDEYRRFVLAYLKHIKYLVRRTPPLLSGIKRGALKEVLDEQINLAPCRRIPN